MNVTYDKDADAAYVYLQDSHTRKSVKKTVPLNENLILDFDANKKIIGIEILSASTVMHKNTLEQMKN